MSRFELKNWEPIPQSEYTDSIDCVWWDSRYKNWCHGSLPRTSADMMAEQKTSIKFVTLRFIEPVAK